MDSKIKEKELQPLKMLQWAAASLQLYPSAPWTTWELKGRGAGPGVCTPLPV